VLCVNCGDDDDVLHVMPRLFRLEPQLEESAAAAGEDEAKAELPAY
jgi:hypothetical protein